MESSNVFYCKFYRTSLFCPLIIFFVDFIFLFDFVWIQITELISTSVVLHLSNTDNQVTPRKILCIVGIALLHIVASGFDQFISNVFKGEGFLHQVFLILMLFFPNALNTKKKTILLVSYIIQR